jgi:hypothetical protein
MGSDNFRSNNNDLPGWVSRMSLAQFILIPMFLTAIGIMMLLGEIADGPFSGTKLIYITCILVLALIFWRMWFRLRRRRSTWHIDE